jgi:hypothetical protein
MTEKNCCDRECNYAGETMTCGTNMGCFQAFSAFVTTPPSQRPTNCPDPKVRTTNVPCESSACADCKFQWSQWSSCSNSCGPGGVQTRTRTVTQDATGQGKCDLSNEGRACMPTLPPCPVPCVVTLWSDWSPCGGTCAPSLRQRVRNIISRDMFGGTTCPDIQDSDQCFALLPLCSGATLPPSTTTTRFIPPTPRPTPSPPPSSPTPTPTAPVELKFNFSTMVTPNSVLPLGQAGSLLAVNNVSPDAALVTVTWANGAIGISDLATNSPGEIVAPFAAQFQFTTRRAIRSITFKNFDASDSAMLVAFNRLGRRRAGETAFIEIKDPNTPLMPRTAIGFDTFEIRPGANSSFGVESIDSPLPDPSMFVATTTIIESDVTAPAARETTDTDTSDALTDGLSSESEGLPTYAIAIIAVVGVVLLIALFVAVFLVGKRRGSQAREQAVPAASVSVSAANTTQQLYSSLDQVPKPTTYSGIVVAPSPTSTYTEMEMTSARENYDELRLQPGTTYFNGEVLSAPSKGSLFCSQH